MEDRGAHAQARGIEGCAEDFALELGRVVSEELREGLGSEGRGRREGEGRTFMRSSTRARGTGGTDMVAWAWAWAWAWEAARLRRGRR